MRSEASARPILLATGCGSAFVAGAGAFSYFNVAEKIKAGSVRRRQSQRQQQIEFENMLVKERAQYFECA